MRRPPCRSELYVLRPPRTRVYMLSPNRYMPAAFGHMCLPAHFGTCLNSAQGAAKDTNGRSQQTACRTLGPWVVQAIKTQRGLHRASSLETRNTWSPASSLETHTVMCAALSFSSRMLRLVRAHILVQPSAALRLASCRNCRPYLLLLVLLLLLLLDARFVLAPVVPLDWHWRRLARYVGVHLRG